MKASTIFLALLLGTLTSSSLAEAPAPRYPVFWKHDQRIATYWGFLPTDVLAELVGPDVVVMRCGTLLSFGNAAITYLFRPGKSENSHRLVAGTSDRIKIGILENHEELESAVLRLMKGLPVTADGRIKNASSGGDDMGSFVVEIADSSGLRQIIVPDPEISEHKSRDFQFLVRWTFMLAANPVIETMRWDGEGPTPPAPAITWLNE